MITHRTIHRWVLAIASAVMAAVLVTVSVEPADAACLPPQLTLSAEAGHVGELISVQGTAFGDGCNDVLVGPGPPPAPLGAPLTGVELQLRQGGRVMVLGVVDAGADYTFSIAVTLPVDATAGPAEVVAVSTGPKTAAPARLTILEPAAVASAAAEPVGTATGGGEGGVVSARPTFTG